MTESPGMTLAEASRGEDVAHGTTPRSFKSHPVLPHVLLVSVLLLLAGIFVFIRLDRGWIPHDEGTLGHAAERVMQGELPHVDFDEVYTGGLTFLNAAVFRLAGPDLIHLRVLIYCLFLLTIPAIYYLSTQFFKPVGAAIVTLLASALSFPNYMAAMPSWYNLFLALLAAAALTLYQTSGRLYWVLIAGVMAGLSCIIKITGLYLVASVLLYLLFLSQSRSGPPLQRRAAGSWSLLMTLCLVTFLGAVVALIAPRLSLSEFLHFITPVGAVIALLLHREWTLPANRVRVQTAITGVVVFLLGGGIVATVFLVPYLITGSLGALLEGVFLSPGSRLTAAAVRPPAIDTAIAAAPVLIALGATQLPISLRRSAGILLAAMFAGFFLWSGEPWVYRGVWFSMRWSGPLAVLIAVHLLWRPPGNVAPRDSTILLLASLTAVLSLNQYPFSAPIYFLYVAPLVALLMAAVVETTERAPRVIGFVMAAFYLAFTCAWMYPGYVHNMGAQFVYDRQTEPFGLDKASLRVSEFDRRQYGALVAVLREKSKSGYTFVGPDAPEVYFLAGLKNPTRHIFEFLAGSGQEEAILEGLQKHDVTAVAIHQWPHFSGRFSEQFQEELSQRYPFAVQVGRFEVRWVE